MYKDKTLFSNLQYNKDIIYFESVELHKVKDAVTREIVTI